MASLDELLARATRTRRLPTPNRGRRLRRAAGISQKELAAALGVTRLTLGRWEAGTAAPTGVHRERYGEALARLAEAIGERVA